MKIRIKSYAPEHVESVLAMNARLAAGGSGWAFYDSAAPAWLPRERPEQPVVRSFHLAMAEDGAVHGGYAFKEQDFLLNGHRSRLATWQGPVSEGLVDRRFRKVGMQCLMDMRDRNPLLFGWGGSPQLNALLDGLGWQKHGTPLVIRLLHPGRVLRGAPFLRAGRRSARLAAIAAATGAAAIGVPLAQWGIARLAGGAPTATVVDAQGFGDWSDRIWEAARRAYRWIAVRDADACTLLMGRPGWPDCRLVRVERDGVAIGWAALRATRLAGDARFGDLKVGCIVDALAVPGQEAAVIAAASRELAKQDVDLIAGYYTHPRWLDAHRRAGYAVVPNRRRLSLSPGFVQAAQEDRFGAPLDQLLSGLHMTPIDGDGPLGF